MQFQTPIYGTVFTDRFAFASDPRGGKTVVSARSLTAAGLNLDSLNWGDPQSVQKAVEAAISSAQSAAAYFGEKQSLLENLQSQATKMGGLLEAGVSNLVDANMGEESAKLRAVQTKQQLAAKTLSIANAAPQWILSLFR